MVGIKNLFKHLDEVFKPVKPPSEIDKILNKIKTIDLSRYENSYSSDLSLFRIPVLEKNIVLYSNTLKKILDNLKSDTIIPTYSLGSEVSSIYLRDFLVDDKGCFINTKEALSTFLNLIVTVLATFQDLERSTNKSFNTEKNLLRIQHVISNLKYLVMNSL